ncbi:MAG: hypothetical protein HOD63_08000 [Bacteroidetes bacterium]|jgi:hypothetical protein|nr:hypothetical protein [Bacteroidota bacterium]MBT5527629.1 hypothetical protein [Cytophagia bacterium]MBT3802352.1 hypothetical protein [Bacteroidota bacterium]MBT3935065.1 hypothetical protein [Bacteroidota bacterium]MBT4338516.1 hypothetical protein [Bacteroidota bacterium]
MKDEIAKKCAFCGRDFSTSNKRKIYCCNSCKVRSYEIRKGKEAPDFLIKDQFDIVKKDVIVKTDNPKYSEIENEINSIQAQWNIKQEKRAKLLAELQSLQNDPGQLLGGMGGFTASYFLTNSVKNEWVRLALMLGSTYAGSEILKSPKQKREAINNVIQQIDGSIKALDVEIKSISSQLMIKRLLLFKTPKEIDKKETKDIKVPRRKQVKGSTKNQESILTASQLSNMEFDLHNLTGKFGEFLGDIAQNTFITAHGQPGSGKSTFFLQLANYFTQFGHVLYATPEEGFSPTFKQKLINNNITSDNIHITAYNSLKETSSKLKSIDFKFCFIDSINMIKDSSPEALEDLRAKYPDVCFAIIMQSTKDGKFKGSNEYAHNSDINIKIEKGVAETIKNRFGKLGTYEVF